MEEYKLRDLRASHTLRGHAFLAQLMTILRKKYTFF